MSRVLVAEYSEEWPKTFEQLRDRIWPALSDFALAVEHVGSTAVPGLAAKPVIDFCVVVRSRADVPLGIERLAQLGYVHRGDLGVPDREAFRRPEGLPRHHLYLSPKDSLSFRNHLALRDHLRADPDGAIAYGALKRQLAKQFPDDIDSYIEGKTAFILETLRGLGFTREELAAIEEINRMDNMVRPKKGGHPTTRSAVTGDAPVRYTDYSGA